MTVTEGGELLCLQYSTFTEKFKNSATFQEWFKPITEGVAGLMDARSGHVPLPDNRLRRLHHLLLELINILDPQELSVGTKERRRAGAAPFCQCLKCLETQGQPAQAAYLWRRAANPA